MTWVDAYDAREWGGDAFVARMRNAFDVLPVGNALASAERRFDLKLRGELCCSITELEVMQKAVRTQRSVLIFEDDACASQWAFDPATHAVLASLKTTKWDVVKLGDCYREGWCVRLFPLFFFLERGSSIMN